MDKKSVKSLAIFLLLIFAINFISAQGASDLIGKTFEGVNNIINIIVGGLLKPFVQLVLTNQGDTISDNTLFAKLLFLLIILGFVHLALGKGKLFEGNAGLHWLIVIVVSLLATRWLGTEALLQTIILPYSVLGIAISAGLPFIIYFLFIELGFKGNEYSLIRKVAWVLFIVVFIGLWVSRRAVITQAGSYAGYIYPVTLLVSIGALLFDGTIQRVWAKSELNKSLSLISFFSSATSSSVFPFCISSSSTPTASKLMRSSDVRYCKKVFIATITLLLI